MELDADGLAIFEQQRDAAGALVSGDAARSLVSVRASRRRALVVRARSCAASSSGMCCARSRADTAAVAAGAAGGAGHLPVVVRAGSRRRWPDSRRTRCCELVALSLRDNLIVILPFAVLLGVVLGLGRLYHDSEIAAAQAGGIGTRSAVSARQRR